MTLRGRGVRDGHCGTMIGMPMQTLAAGMKPSAGMKTTGAAGDRLGEAATSLENDQRLAILRVRVAPGCPRRFGNFNCRPAVDGRNVMQLPTAFLYPLHTMNGRPRTAKMVNLSIAIAAGSYAGS